MFSMLHVTQDQITNLEVTRAMLPVYKVDEKATKKSQKVAKERMSGGLLSTGGFGGGGASMTEPNDYQQDTGDSFG